MRKLDLLSPRQAFFMAYLAISTLTSCSVLPPSRCSQADSISERALLDLAVEKIVRSSLASADADEVRYSTLNDFYEANPFCCYLSRGALTSDRMVKLPINQETELSILYRRFRHEKEPYRLRHVTVGPCPVDQEEADTRLSVEDYDIKLTQKLGRKIV